MLGRARRSGEGAGGGTDGSWTSAAQLAIWVISFIDTDPRGTRAGRLQGSPTTTLNPPLGPTREVKRHSARRQQFDYWTRYLNAAKANLEFFSTLRGFWCSHLPPRQHLRPHRHWFERQALGRAGTETWKSVLVSGSHKRAGSVCFYMMVFSCGYVFFEAFLKLGTNPCHSVK